ncbi:hypothetical protein B0T14DRAFT_587709 [Immersiella caudata]|uniref:Uncharacterized protein n=1 Tax=Immersiella caudata TaxID=314043 RepID=A0AA39WSN3_9PEZI|nr:hypothetical protein B0T14DRAFT_587709 [Immersiella caudata]
MGERTGSRAFQYLWSYVLAGSATSPVVLRMRGCTDPLSPLTLVSTPSSAPYSPRT